MFYCQGIISQDFFSPTILIIFLVINVMACENFVITFLHPCMFVLVRVLQPA